MRKQMIRGFLVGLAFAAGAGVFPAHASLQNTRITHPTDGATISGAAQVDFETTTDSGIASANLEITGANAPGIVWEDTPPAGTTGRYGKSYTWVTTTLTPYNGAYTVTFTAEESVSGQVRTDSISVNVSNPPATPVWAAAPRVVTGSDGRKVVTLSWKANPEPDMREYRIIRVDPSGDEHVLGPVSAPHPDYQGCTLSSGVYACRDSSFASTGYGGTYTYRLKAVRSSPTPDDQCALDAAGNPTSSGGSCVSSSDSPAKSATLVEPKPSPTPTTKPSTGTGGGGTRIPTTTGPAAPQAPRTYLPGEDPREFFQGSYSPTLPYEPKTLIETPVGVGGGSKEVETKVEAAKTIRTVGEPLDARGKILPVAGGLLAILSAAHVRRLLRDH